MDDRATLRAEIDEAWRPYAAILNSLSDDELLTHADGTWTRKDVVAHVAWWEASSADALAAVAAGRAPAWRDETTDATNARIEAEWKTAPTTAVRAFAAAAHERLLAGLGAVNEADLWTSGRFAWMDGDPLAEMIRGDSSRHYPDHLDALGG